MKPAIAYIRVSTQKQGRSGLGLEAQQAAIATFAANYGFTITATFVEVETGKGADALATRPQLAAAIEAAKGATLIVAKLDRLTRDVHFGSGLMLRRDVSFRISDMPHADNFQINIMLSVAQLEREMISTRTKAALQAAKQRGTKLGSPTTPAILKDRSCAFAESLRAIVAPRLDMPTRALSDWLNAQGIKTSTGGAWQPRTVIRLVERLGPAIAVPA